MGLVRIGLVLRLVVALALTVLMVSGCKSGFRTQVETVASNIGRNADDVERAFRRALPAADDAQLELAASRSATRTSWIKTLGRSALAEWQEQQTLRAIAGGTCEVVSLVDDAGETTTQAQLEQVIRNHIRAQGLAPTDRKIADVAKGIAENLQSLINSGRFDEDVLVDLACLPF